MVVIIQCIDSSFVNLSFYRSLLSCRYLQHTTSIASKSSFPHMRRRSAVHPPCCTAVRSAVHGPAPQICDADTGTYVVCPSVCTVIFLALFGCISPLTIDPSLTAHPQGKRRSPEECSRTLPDQHYLARGSYPHLMCVHEPPADRQGRLRRRDRHEDRRGRLTSGESVFKCTCGADLRPSLKASPITP